MLMSFASPLLGACIFLITALVLANVSIVASAQVPSPGVLPTQCQRSAPVFDDTDAADRDYFAVAGSRQGQQHDEWLVFSSTIVSLAAQDGEQTRAARFLQAAASQSPTNTKVASTTRSPSHTPTRSKSMSATASKSLSPTRSRTNSFGASRTPTATPTPVTPTISVTASKSPSKTASVSRSFPKSLTATRSPGTQSRSPSQAPTPGASVSLSSSTSFTRSTSPPPSETRSVSTTATASPTISYSATATKTIAESLSIGASPSSSTSMTAAASASPSPASSESEGAPTAPTASPQASADTVPDPSPEPQPSPSPGTSVVASTRSRTPTSSKSFNGGTPPDAGPSARVAMSTGTVAGVAVGAAVVGLVLVSAVVLWRRTQKAQAEAALWVESELLKSAFTLEKGSPTGRHGSPKGTDAPSALASVAVDSNPTASSAATGSSATANGMRSGRAYADMGVAVVATPLPSSRDSALLSTSKRSSSRRYKKHRSRRSQQDSGSLSLSDDSHTAVYDDPATSSFAADDLHSLTTRSMRHHLPWSSEEGALLDTGAAPSSRVSFAAQGRRRSLVLGQLGSTSQGTHPRSLLRHSASSASKRGYPSVVHAMIESAGGVVDDNASLVGHLVSEHDKFLEEKQEKAAAELRRAQHALAKAAEATRLGSLSTRTHFAPSASNYSFPSAVAPSDAMSPWFPGGPAPYDWQAQVQWPAGQASALALLTPGSIAGMGGSDASMLASPHAQAFALNHSVLQAQVQAQTQAQLQAQVQAQAQAQLLAQAQAQGQALAQAQVRAHAGSQAQAHLQLQALVHSVEPPHFHAPAHMANPARSERVLASADSGIAGTRWFLTQTPTPPASPMVEGSVDGSTTSHRSRWGTSRTSAGNNSLRTASASRSGNSVSGTSGRKSSVGLERTAVAPQFTLPSRPTSRAASLPRLGASTSTSAHALTGASLNAWVNARLKHLGQEPAK